MATYILLCKGNEGKQLITEGHLQIRLYQLNKINREQIIKEYMRISGSDETPVNLITKKRNFYIDVLLANNQQLFVTSDEKAEAITSSKIDFPLELQVIFPNQQFMIESQVDLNIQFFNILYKIGEGTFAQIFLAQQKFDKKLVCIKRINKAEFLQRGSKQMIINEFTALKYKHAHKVNLLYMFENSYYVFFVTEYCVFGDLYSLIRNQREVHQCQVCEKLNKKQKYSIWLQVAFMIVHMHQKGFIYRDLKPQNILIDERGFVKLCDFGYCTKFQKNQRFKQLCGTLQYIPPELVQGNGYDKTIDIYGLGILLYEIIANKTPFEDITLENMHQKKKAAILFDKKLFSPIQRELIENLTKQEPEERLGYYNSMSIFKHPFFESNQVLPVVQNIIKKVPNFLMLLKVHETGLEEYKTKQQVLIPQKQFFQKPYNYLSPDIQIQEKMGPKFNSGF